MNINRIQHIRDHRVFRDFTWPADLQEFSRFNLVYGWNGSGKTTLSGLFRQLQQSNPQAIQEGEFEFVIGQQAVSSRSLDRASIPPVRVFNRNSIDASVFETVGKQFSPIYFLGENSVEKQKQVETLKGKLEKEQADYANARNKLASSVSDFETFCTDQARIIREILTAPGGSYNNYDKRNFKEAAKRFSEENYKSYLLDEQEYIKLKQAKDERPRPRIPLFQSVYPDLAELTRETQRLLTRSVVSSLLEELVNDHPVASWVGDGLLLHTGIHKSENCHFCGQKLPDERLQKLQAHFNDDFKQFQVELANTIAQIESAKSQVEGMQPPEQSLLYEHLRDDYQSAVTKVALHRTYIVLYLDALVRALAAKREVPFSSIALLPFFGVGLQHDQSVGFLESIFSAVMFGAGVLGALQGKEAFEKMGLLIETHNNLTDNYVKGITKARQDLEAHLIADVFEEHKRKQDLIDSAKAREEKVNSAVKELRDNIASLLRAIRQHHRPAAELTSEMSAYLARDELAFIPHENGYSLTRYGRPASNLSEGEKSAIAFLYFLKSLQDADFDLKNGVVVIDDPVSSLDANSLYSAFGFMKERTKNAGQLFILTHNFAFFRLAKNWFKNLRGRLRNTDRFYMLTSTVCIDHRNSVIRPLDTLLRDYESEYHYLFKCIFDEANRPAGEVALSVNYGMPNMARRVLEAFLAFRLPGTADIYNQMEQISYDSAKKTRILRFLDTHSHLKQITEPEHDLSILAETQTVLLDVLGLIEDMDKGHYLKMLAVVGYKESQGEDAGLNELPQTTQIPASF